MLIGDSNSQASAGTRRDGTVDSRLVFHGLPGRSREEVLAQLSRRVAEEGFVREPAELLERLVEREKLGCTGLGGGIAIPHCKLNNLDEVVVAVASTQTPVDFAAADGVPVGLIFLVASPAEAAAAHLQALARISRLLRTPGVVERLRDATSQARLLDVLREAEAGLSVVQ